MTKYTMTGYEIGTYLEIYLPKRTAYQTFLYEILTKGFEIEHIRQHFLSENKRAGILNLLGENPAWSNYDEAYIARLRPFLHGYSMYEVDGVFKGQNMTVVEERTQVLRMIFRIDLDEIIEEAALTNVDRRMVRARVSDYLRANHRDDLLAEGEDDDRRILEAARAWRDQLGFFIFGYVIYEICVHIEKLCKDQRIGKVEDEVWVTHFANLEIDRVVSPVSVHGNK